MNGGAMTDSIVAAPRVGALAAEHYQTFEMAKEHDTVLGSDDIAQIRTYAAYARAQAQAIHKTIAATSGIEDVAAIKAEAVETEQTFAKVGIYADQRIGEILRELPKAKGNQYTSASVGAPTKAQAEKQAGIDHHTAYDLQAMAANPEVVQAVLDKAEADGTIPSRSQVLKAIKERDAAKHERDVTNRVALTLKAERDEAREQYQRDVQDLQAEIAALERQNDELYAQAHPKPKVVERTVEVESEASKKRISDLEHERDLYLSDLQKLRKRNSDLRDELDKAKLLIGEKQRGESAQWDISALTTATNNYLRQYGGKAWAFDQFYRVDEVTQSEFVKAINNLAAFAQNLAQMIREQSNE